MNETYASITNKDLNDVYLKKIYLIMIYYKMVVVYLDD